MLSCGLGHRSVFTPRNLLSEIRLPHWKLVHEGEHVNIIYLEGCSVHRCFMNPFSASVYSQPAPETRTLQAGQRSARHQRMYPFYLGSESAFRGSDLAPHMSEKSIIRKQCLSRPVSLSERRHSASQPWAGRPAEETRTPKSHFDFCLEHAVSISCGNPSLLCSLQFPNI